MGVYIKGMEMPKNCGECLLAKLSPTGESLICNYMLSRVSWKERPFDCPLIPVPEHGRLIDADALIRGNGIKEIPEYYEVVCNAPTIIEAEESEA